MKEATIYEPNAFKDPITNFLFSKWQNFFTFMFLFSSLQIIVSFHSGTLFIQEKSVSTMEDLPIVFTYLVVASLFFLVRRFFSHIPQAFQTLFTNEILTRKKGSTRENVLIDFNESLQEFETLINSKYMYISAFLFYFLVITNFIILLEPAEGAGKVFWYNFHSFPLNWIVIIITAPLMWFVVGILIWKMYCMASFMKTLTHQYEFDLNPYNPDGFGGFKPLGQIWINMAFTIVPFLLLHTAIFVYGRFLEFPYPSEQEYIDIAIMISYTIVVFVFLIYPMKKYHDIVRAQKSEYLRNINEKVDKLWRIREGPLLPSENEDSDRTSLEQFERSQRFVHVAGKIPSWPFTPSERIGVLLIALIPWILEIVHYLVSLFQE